MSRRSDRKHAFELVFQIAFYPPGELRESTDIWLSELGELENINRDFIEKEFEGVLLHQEVIDDLIATHAEGWSVPRLSKTDLAIIRVCVYEMLYAEDIPNRVAINEAVELAKIYSSDEAPAFINGVLGKIAAGIAP